MPFWGEKVGGTVMNALKRILAMVMVIAMLMSMAIAEDNVLMIDQSGEMHVHDEYAIETAEADAPALEEIVIDLAEEPVEEAPVEEEPAEEIPAEVPATEEETEQEAAPEAGLSDLPEMIVPEEESVVEEEGDLMEIELISSQASAGAPVENDGSLPVINFDPKVGTENYWGEYVHPYATITDYKGYSVSDFVEVGFMINSNDSGWKSYYVCNTTNMHYWFNGIWETESSYYFSEGKNVQFCAYAVLSDGKCAYSNTWINDDYCTHPYAQPEYRGHTNFEWTSFTAQGHTGTYDVEQEYYCPDCEEWFYKIVETGVAVTNEPHDWRYGWYAEEQIEAAFCEICGYLSTCDHSFEATDVDEKWEWDSDTAVDHGNGTHTITYYDDILYECVHCGVTYWETDYDNGYEVTESHNWYYDEYVDETGCRQCSATNTCDHQFTEEWDGRWLQGAWDNGNGTHTVEYYDVYRVTCDLCGADYTYDGEELQTVTEPHEFYDGECHECGAINTCDHPADALMENGHNPYYNAVVHSCDETTHTISAYTSTWYLCTACGQDFQDVTAEFTTVNKTLRHEWDQELGECWICGMENDCTHENVNYSYTYIQPDWEHGDPILDVNANTHTFRGYECTEGECPDCGMWMREQTGEVQEYTRAHEYYGSKRCNVCDYMLACTHPKGYVYSTYYAYYGDATKVDNLTHSTVAYLVTTATCPLCGYYVESKGAATTFLEKHYYGSTGVCYECGHQDTGACEHDVVNTFEYPEIIKSYAGDATGHTSQVRDVYEEECALCGRIVKKEYSELYEDYYIHDLNGAGICESCGYVSACAHTSVTPESGSGYYFNAVNAYAHQTIYYKNTSYFCNQCGSHLSSYGSHTTTPGALAYHTWVNGFCSGCQMPQPGVCQHRYEDGECVKCGAACTHNYVDCVCTVCGMDTHEWDGCVCTKCGAGEHAVGLNDCWCEDCWQTVHNVVNHVCTRCGECDHEHPFGSVCEPCKWCGYTEHVEENFTSAITRKVTGYKDLSAEGVIGYHAELLSAYKVTACTVCGQIVSEERAPEWDEEVNVGHTFWQGEDTCADCGAAKPECPDNWEGGVHHDNGNGVCKHCWYCLVHFDGIADDPDMYDWGYCLDCNYYNRDFDPTYDGHTHIPWDNYVWYELAEDPECVYLDANRHVFIGKQIKVFECDICGALIEEETGAGNVSVIESHYGWETDFCEGCGAYMSSDAACTHENTYWEKWIDFDWDTGIVDIDKLTHSAYGWEVGEEYCADCGNYVDSDWDTSTAPNLYEVPHSYDYIWIDDVEVYCCVDCGYEPTLCKWHSWTTEWDRDDVDYATVDQYSHAMYGASWYVDTCSVCGMQQRRSIAVNGVQEAHNYVNGICGDCGAKLVELTGVKINGLDANNSLTVGYMMSVQLDYESVPANSAIKPAFISSNPYVASVDANGKITGRYPGSAVITITADNLENEFKPISFTVNVAAAPYFVGVQDAPYGGDMLAVGETVQLNASVLPADTIYTLTFSSSNEAVAVVDANGLVKGVGAGYAYIYAKTQNNLYDTYLVKVAAAPESMDLGIDGNVLEMGLGMTYQVKPAMTPAGAGSEITYVSSNADVASVDANGRIIAKAKGEATITVSTWGVETQEIAVEVKNAPASVSFARSAVTASLAEGSMQLKPIIAEDEGTQFTWISGNSAVASVDANGLVTFRRAGTVLVAAVAHNGQMALCSITIMPYAPSKITVEPAVVDMLVGEKKELKISFGLYEGCSDLKVSESEYFTYEDGILTAKKVTDGPVELVFEAPNSTAEKPVKASCQVNIYPELKDIAITVNGEKAADTLKLSYGQTIDLGVQRWDVNGEEMFAGDYTISCDNPYIATIFATNKLYVRGIGKAVITVKAYNGAEDTLEIEAVAAPYAVTMTPNSAILGKGEKMELSVSHQLPEAPTTYTFYSTNEYVAKVVEENGKYYVVAGENMGYSNIIVATHNGKYAFCTVAVYNAPTAVALDKTELTLASGETAQLTTSLQPQLSASAITWKSSNEAVAKVEGGKVIAVAKGTATITAETYNSTADAPIKASCEVTVNNAPASIVLEVAEKMSVGQLAGVKVKLLDKDGNETTGAYTLETSDSRFAWIYNGQVYACYPTWENFPVTVKVKAYNSTEENRIEDEVAVTVTAAPYYVNMVPGSYLLGQGEKTELTVSHYLPEAPTTYTFYSTNENVAKVVEENGKYYVQAGSTFGFANIIVGTHNGKYASCRITVYLAPTAVALDKTELTLAAGEEAQLATSLQPLYAASAIAWKSSNEAVARVENGKVIAVAKGEATITAETYNSTADAPIKASCQVKVNNAPASVVLEVAEKMSVGQLAPVKVTLLDAEGNETTGAYTVESNYPVFAMMYNGQVYARFATMDAYPVYITAKAFNGAEAKVQLTIVNAPYALQFEQASVTLNVGVKGSVKDALKVIPEGTPTSFAYASSNPNVVTVNAEGEIETKAEGYARITVASHNGRYAFLWIIVDEDYAPPVVM